MQPESDKPKKEIMAEFVCKICGRFERSTIRKGSGEEKRCCGLRMQMKKDRWR